MEQNIIFILLIIAILILVLFLENETTKEGYQEKSLYTIKNAVANHFNIKQTRISNLKYQILEGSRIIDMSFTIMPRTDESEPTSSEILETLKLYRAKTFKLRIDNETYNATYHEPGDNVNYKGLYEDPKLDELIGFIEDIKRDGLVNEPNMDRFFGISENRRKLIKPNKKL